MCLSYGLSLKQEEDKQLVGSPPPHSEAADHNYDYVCDLVQRAQEMVTLQYNNNVCRSRLRRLCNRLIYGWRTRCGCSCVQTDMIHGWKTWCDEAVYKHLCEESKEVSCRLVYR